MRGAGSHGVKRKASLGIELMFGEMLMGRNTSYVQIFFLKHYSLRAENPFSEFGYCLHGGFCEDNN